MLLLLLLISSFLDTYQSYVQNSNFSQPLKQMVCKESFSDAEEWIKYAFKHDLMIQEHPTALLDSFEQYITDTNYTVNPRLLSDILAHSRSLKHLSFSQIMIIQMLSYHLKSKAVPALAENIGIRSLKEVCLAALSIATGKDIRALEKVEDIQRL